MNDMIEVIYREANSIDGDQYFQSSVKENERSGCLMVCGDLDYVANQTVIRDSYDFNWMQWERKIRKTIELARNETPSLISLYARSRTVSEAKLLERLVLIANDYPDVGVLFHFFSVEAMSHALDIYEGRPLINYISGERWLLDKMLPMLKHHPIPVVAQLVSDIGIPPTASARLDIALRIADTLEQIGIDRQNIYVDSLTPALGTLPFPLAVSIETITAVKEAGFRTILWPTNAGLGHSDGEIIATAYASMAVHAGLNLAVVARTNQLLRTAITKANHILKGE